MERATARLKQDEIPSRAHLRSCGCVGMLYLLTRISKAWPKEKVSQYISAEQVTFDPEVVPVFCTLLDSSKIIQKIHA